MSAHLNGKLRSDWIIGCAGVEFDREVCALVMTASYTTACDETSFMQNGATVKAIAWDSIIHTNVIGEGV